MCWVHSTGTWERRCSDQESVGTDFQYSPRVSPVVWYKQKPSPFMYIFYVGVINGVDWNWQCCIFHIYFHVADVNTMGVLSNNISGDEIHWDIIGISAVIFCAVKVCAAQLLDVSLEARLGNGGSPSYVVAVDGISLNATTITVFDHSASWCLVEFLSPTRCGLGDTLLLDSWFGIVYLVLKKTV